MTTIEKKTRSKIGNWNSKMMFQPSKHVQVIKEITNYKLDILGTGEHMLPSSSQTKSTTSVALILNKITKGSLLRWGQIQQKTVKADSEIQHC